MAYKINDLIIGEVINVKPFAAFLEFDEGVQGLLHISEISDAFIRDIEKFVSVGDKLKVKVLSIDPNNGFLRISLKQVPQNEAYSTHINGKNKMVEVKAADFDKLKEKLPGWIEQTLQRMKDKEND